MIPRHRKPKQPVPGKPAGQIGSFEIKQTATRVGYTGFGMVLMLINMVASFANDRNVTDMLARGGYFGGSALMIVGACVIIVKRMTNNTGKRL